jgi:hypothetical protein
LKNNVKFVTYYKTITRFSNQKLINDFVEFHNNNTTLRFVDREEHKKKTRKKTFKLFNKEVW